MPRKRINRRYRRKKTLSNYSIATKTSAKAQSKQIYSIKKRINRIQRLTKPQIKLSINKFAIQASPGVITRGYDMSGYGTQRLSFINDQDSTSVVNYLVAPPLSFCRLNTFSMYGNLQFNTLSETIHPFSLRVVVLQTRATRASTINTNDVFAHDSFTNSTDEFTPVYGPLQTGLARLAKVLSDKRYTLSYQRPNINLRTTLRYLLNQYKDRESSSGDDGAGGSSSEDYPKGSIWVFLAWYSLNGSGATAHLDITTKLAYTSA